MTIEKGVKAPVFELFDHENSAFSLSDTLADHPVLLLFFPGAFTGVCTTEMNTVNNDLEAFGPDTRVVGISTDSPFALAEFSRVNGFQFPLLSDHTGEVSAQYGARYNNDFTHMKLDRISRRSAFVIDQKGIIRYAEVLENAGDLPNLEAIQAVLKSL